MGALISSQQHKRSATFTASSPIKQQQTPHICSSITSLTHPGAQAHLLSLYGNPHPYAKCFPVIFSVRSCPVWGLGRLKFLPFRKSSVESGFIILFWAEKAFSGLKSMGLGEVECNER